MYCSDTTKGSNDFGDLTLRLDSFGYGTKKPKNEQANGSHHGDDACELALGYSKHLSHLRHDSILQLGLSRDKGLVLHELEGSDSTHNPFKRNRGRMDDEGSTSVKRSGGYLTNLVLAPSMATTVVPPNGPKPSSKAHSVPTFSVFEPGSTITTATATTTTSSDAPKESRFLVFARRSSKRCVFARGKSGPGNILRGSAVKGISDSTGGPSSGLSVMSDPHGSYERPEKRRGGLIPPQVLVPLSMKASAISGADEFSGPEGRVHGGALLSSLRRDDDGGDLSRFE